MKISKCGLDQKIKFINRCIGFLSLCLLACIVFIVIESFLKNDWHISISITGIKNIIAFWQEFSPLLVAFISTLTLWIASSQLAKYLQMATITALGELRKMLNSDPKKKIHNYLLDVDDKKVILEDLYKESKELNDSGNASVTDTKECKYPNIELFDYLGTIELGAIMLRKGIISREEFFSQFGYRAENLWSNQAIKDHIMKCPKYYKDFLYIVNTFDL